MIPRLDPEYIAFHTKEIQYIVPPHTVKWDPAIRTGPVVPGNSAALDVAKTQDYDLKKTKARAFTPFGEAPVDGWPVFIFFHGGMSIIRWITPALIPLR